MAMAARDAGMRGLLLPRKNANEAAVVSEIEIIPVDSLTQAVGFLAGTVDIAAAGSHKLLILWTVTE